MANPTATPVTKPELETVALLVSLLDHVTALLQWGAVHTSSYL